MGVQRRSFAPKLLLVATAVLGLGTQVHAVSVLNPSFESPVTGGFTDDSQTSISHSANWGWSYFFADTTDDHDAGVQVNPNAGITSPSPDGTAQDGWVNGGGNYLYQDVGVLLPNTTYTLTVDVAAPGSGNYAGFNPAGGGSATNAETDVLELLNDATNPQPTIGSVAVTGSVLNSATVTPTAGLWTSNNTVSYTTGASVSGDLTIILEQTAAGAHEQGVFDNVRLTAAAVPEPTSAGLLCLGSLLALRRRKAR
jgi:hypothetical protein